MLEILSQDLFGTPAPRELREHRIVLKHALRGGLLSVVSFLGPAITGLVTGSLVVETIFQIPGLGRFFVMAGFTTGSYTMLMGTVLFYAFLGAGDESALWTSCKFG
jgi:oligopeptide transport system permease protein